MADRLSNVPTKDDLAALETRFNAKLDQFKSDLEAVINGASRKEGDESPEGANNHGMKGTSMQVSFYSVFKRNWPTAAEKYVPISIGMRPWG